MKRHNNRKPTTGRPYIYTPLYVGEGLKTLKESIEWENASSYRKLQLLRKTKYQKLI